MAKIVFIASLAVCALATGLSQIPDPGVLGIRDEPSTILFYGGLGLLAGFSGLIAVGSGAYLAITRFGRLSAGQRRILLTTFLILAGAIVVAGVIRFFPW